MPAKNDYWDDPEKQRQKSLDYYYENHELCREKQRAYYQRTKDARKIQAKLHREANLEKIKAKQKEYYLENREKRIAQAKAYRNSDPEFNLKRGCRRHSITPEAYRILLDQQSGGCAICGDLQTKLNIDHDHSCCAGKNTCGQCVRGLLCSLCNTALGLVRDNPSILRKAADYLENRRCV
jgi:hypothetical protein